MADRVEQLQALMLRVEVALISCADKDVAAHSREKRQILAELDALDGAGGGVIDDLSDARKRRRAAAAASATAK